MKVSSKEPISQNEAIIIMIAKIATSTINRLTSSKDDVLYSPKTIEELENNTSMVSNIVSIKLKNSLLQN